MEVWTCQSKQATGRHSGADSYQVGGHDVKGGGPYKSTADVANVKKQVSLWQIGGMCYQSPRVFTVCVCFNSSMIKKNSSLNLLEGPALMSPKAGKCV